MSRNTHETREGWLVAAMKTLDEEFFKGRGYALPEKLQVSCGFPRGHARAIGQCWDPKVSADGTTHMFICPTQAEPIMVLAILLHEMIHASVGIEAGHKGPFRKLVKEFGLAGKMTATFAEEGSELHGKLAVFRDRLGPYPHAPMQKKFKRGKPSGWIRLYSEHDEKYTVVISEKSIENHGYPTDPWGDEMKPKGE